MKGLSKTWQNHSCVLTATKKNGSNHYLDSLSSPRFSSSSSLPLYSYSVSSVGRGKNYLITPKTKNCSTLQVFGSHLFTFLSPLFARAVNVIFELNSDLPFSGLVPDKRMLEQLLCALPAVIGLDEATLYKLHKFLRPGRKVKVRGETPFHDKGSWGK